MYMKTENPAIHDIKGRQPIAGNKTHSKAFTFYTSPAKKGKESDTGERQERVGWGRGRRRK